MYHSAGTKVNGLGSTITWIAIQYQEAKLLTSVAMAFGVAPIVHGDFEPTLKRHRLTSKLHAIQRASYALQLLFISTVKQQQSQLRHQYLSRINTTAIILIHNLRAANYCQRSMRNSKLLYKVIQRPYRTGYRLPLHHRLPVSTKALPLLHLSLLMLEQLGTYGERY